VKGSRTKAKDIWVPDQVRVRLIRSGMTIRNWIPDCVRDDGWREDFSVTAFLRNDRGRGKRGKVKGMRIFLLQHGTINLYTQRN